MVFETQRERVKESPVWYLWMMMKESEVDGRCDTFQDHILYYMVAFHELYTNMMQKKWMMQQLFWEQILTYCNMCTAVSYTLVPMLV